MEVLSQILAGLSPETVEQWLAAGGYFLLFAILFACGLGFPMPEDVPLIAAGVLIAKGQMHWVPAAILAWCGIIGGDLVLYHIGKKFGHNITRVPYVGKHINVARLAQIERGFAKYGILVVGVGRMFAGIRGAMVVTAGTIRYPLWKFLLADGLAAILSGGLFMFLGFKVGENLPFLMKKVEEGKFILLIASLFLGTAAFFWWRRKRKSRLSTTPDPATPTLPQSDLKLPS